MLYKQLGNKIITRVKIYFYRSVKLRSHFLPVEPRTTLVSYWDDLGRSGDKLLLRSHLPLQHYGNSKLTPRMRPDHPGRAKVKLRFMPVLRRMFPDDPGALSQLYIIPQIIPFCAGRATVLPRCNPGRSRQS
jgi:hypothetical protein